MSISENVRRVLDELPEGVCLEAAAKTRTSQEILEAVEAGACIIGQNYVREAEDACREIGRRASWHLIGHLQRNKVKRAVEIFDLIETVDSAELAREIDKRCAVLGKIMPVLIEVNSAREPRKSGVPPERVEALAREIATLPHLKLAGLMTMGPETADPEQARPYFRETKQLFDRLAGLGLPGADFRYLSMGMTATYRVAVQEGASLVRLGSRIFGPRQTPDKVEGGR